MSVVTACRNMRPWIEETVESVTGQRYPDLEYIVVDGASTDGTAEWLAGRRDQFSRFVSEPDAGQYHAIQKGLEMATGEVMGWINADDILLPWTLRTVARVFTEFPDVDWIVGLPAYLNTDSECFLVSPVAAAYPRGFIRNGWFREGLLGYLMQESMFWRRSLWEKAGGLNLDLKLAADFDLWTRFAQHAELTAVATPLSAFRVRGQENRSRVGDGYRREVAQCCSRLPAPPVWWRALARLGKPGEAALRLGLWRRAPVVAHALTGDRWLKLRTLRHVSRNDISRLMLERRLRGQR